MIGEVSQYHWPVERVVEHREDLQQDVRIPVGEAIPFAQYNHYQNFSLGLLTAFVENFHTKEELK